MSCKRKRIPKWTLPLFLERAKEIHGQRYDYSRIQKGDIKNKNSYIPIICTICNCGWMTRINNHIIGKQGCPNCFGKTPYNLERFLIKARKVHGDRYDYSQVKEKHIKNNLSYVPIRCTICNHYWKVSINNHINHRTGCPNYVNHL